MQHFTRHTLAAATRPDPLPDAPLLFAGTPEIAATALRRLAAAGAQFAAVLTRPDAPVGRKRRLTPSPVAQAAEDLGLPVIRADRVDEEVTAQLTTTGAQLGIVVAYGALLPRPALDALPLGWVNLHYSALPAHRGAAPVPHSILAGDETTAATVFQLEPGMDTGPLHGMCDYPIDVGISAGKLLEELTEIGSELLQVLLPRLLDGTSEPTSQQGEPSYAGKLRRSDAYVDPRATADEVARRANATIPEPGAWTWHGDRRLKLGPLRPLSAQPPDSDLPHTAEPRLAAEPSEPGTVLTVDSAGEGGGTGGEIAMRTGDGGAVLLSTVQPEGKQMMEAQAWLRGQQGPVVLGTAPQTLSRDRP